jgi:hypothetical protein
MENSKGINDWIPLLTKLVWPVIIIILLIVFNRQVSELYTVVMKSIKEGRNVEIGGFLKLGEAASSLEIGSISQEEISIISMGGGEGVVRKGSASELERILDDLRQNPSKTISTMLINNDIYYSADLLRQYVGTLGLKYVVFQKNGLFDGWILSGNFVLQLPEGDRTFSYNQLRENIIGVNTQHVKPQENTRQVLSKMQEWRMDALPVVDDDSKWLFFTTRGEILSSLMTNIMLEEESN